MAPDETQTAAVDDELLEDETTPEQAPDYPAFKVRSTRLAAHRRLLRRADPGKTKRKLFIAGHRVLPKKHFEVALTAEQVEDEKPRLAEYCASGLIELLEHQGDGEYTVYDLALHLDAEAPVPAVMKPEEEPAEEDNSEDGNPDSDEPSESSDEEPEEYTREDLEMLTKSQLIEIATENEIDPKGNKAELVSRILGEE